MYIDQLALVWMEDPTAETTGVGIEQKIDSFIEGDLKHATEMLSALWEIVNKDGDIKTPSNTLPAVSIIKFYPLPRVIITPHNQATKITSPSHWTSVKVALVNSIRKGVLFDRKYWARHSKTGDALKPVYFSSVIMGDRVQQLKNCASEFDCGSPKSLRVHSGEIS